MPNAKINEPKIVCYDKFHKRNGGLNTLRAVWNIFVDRSEHEQNQYVFDAVIQKYGEDFKTPEQLYWPCFSTTLFMTFRDLTMKKKAQNFLPNT